MLKFNELLQVLRETEDPLHKKTTAYLNGTAEIRHSLAMFEQFRIKAHSTHKMVMQDAKEAFECLRVYKKAHQLLTRAVVFARRCLQAEFVKTPYVRGMPELQKEHSLALLLGRARQLYIICT